ncbi:cobaltochelatase subunit CobN [Leptolyngbya sp. 'hensonii']|uniref:cobaltochelatase subunit CobN n=1 Tax=Leptolyngbya sp. 'hensonii' TaxID=1922337 RepID=UPI00094F9E3B|nr:cobaltochelatase subunit CobN [Leptolyngbya sp. 'hensonii']OLP18021.1 cobaltochelatase subunit CobN [Leptolyngbya sp. 'hensonii']
MHRLAAAPGGWDSQAEGVIFVEQTPADLVILTAADTDIQTLAGAVPRLPAGFPSIRVVNLLQLQQQLTIDTYAETVLQQAKVIVVRLLGGRAYWSYGLEVVRELVQQTGGALLVLPGDDRPDPDLLSHSTVPLAVVNRLWQYFTEGGVENLVNALKFMADNCLGTSFQPQPPQVIPYVGQYEFVTLTPISEKFGSSQQTGLQSSLGRGLGIHDSLKRRGKNHRVGILFYRALVLSGNTGVIDALCQALVERHLEPVPLYVFSPRDPDAQQEMLKFFRSPAGQSIDLLLNATSFSVARLDQETPDLDLWQQLQVPVLQVIFSSGSREQWQSRFQGLSPRDMAINVALPEVDGRIISRAVSFKAVQSRCDALETDVVVYEPEPDRIQFVADLAAHWIRLRQTPVPERRIALILANYPTRDGRLANGVGLDTPASCIEILKALQQAGYWVENIPTSGDDLVQQLTAGVTNDPEGRDLRPVHQSLPLTDYRRYFTSLPAEVQAGITDRWSSFPTSDLPIYGLQFGHIFVGIQPARGYDLDPALNYHAPDLEPPHTYLAFYAWVRQQFQAQAIVHVGKHGNLEWLPGKSAALGPTCYPEVVLGPMPHLYPFIVNDPGEGAQAKRRTQAVILDHLTPPMTRAELYGPLERLEVLIDEYYEAQNLNPSRLPTIAEKITTLVIKENLHQDLNIEPVVDAAFLTRTDAYLCELKEAQIRDGLHIFGCCPRGRQLRDLTVAIARQPGGGRLGLTRALARDLGLDFDPLSPSEEGISGLRDGIDRLEEQAADLVDQLIREPGADLVTPCPGAATLRELEWVRDRLLPALFQTRSELTHLLQGLDGGYVPSGPSGAPTRGRPEVLPTGRNFYTVDIRAVPTESAWDTGRKAAEILVERYTQEHGEYPRTLGLSIWGTATMRTGGDDLAEALALLGVRPVWDGPSRRVVDFEILPLSALGRPRVDVTLRVSGFFRDAFPNLIDLFDQAIAAVAALEEPADQNPLAAQVRQEAESWEAAGLTLEQAAQQAHYRIFGSRPGAYGAGLQGLIESQNWTDDADLARAYINWSSYAYSRRAEGQAAPAAFEQRLRQMQVVLHNQDNREHDLLDSDDYYQFQGGLAAAVRMVAGREAQTYFGDNALPESPKVRLLREEIARVYRSRVINPKWIAGVMRHGYKGAAEMAATVDFLFAYDATARCVADYMYQDVAEAYLLQAEVQTFIQQSNPWALRDMAERLLEANQRGLWQGAESKLLDELRSIVHRAEADIEQRSHHP